MKRLPQLLAACFLLAATSLVQADVLDHVPTPRFIGDVVIDRPAIELGESFTLTATVQNTNDLTGGAGRIVIAFPDLTDSGDHSQVLDAGDPFGDSEGYLEISPGEPTYCSPGVPYLSVAYVDSDWGTSESNTLRIRVRPNQDGVFLMDAHAFIVDANGPCAFAVRAVPPNGALLEDESGLSIKRFAVNVRFTPLQSTSWSRIKALYIGKGAL